MSGLHFMLSDGGTAETVAARLTANGAAANEMLPVMARIAQNMYEIEAILFRSGGRRGGGSWKRLKPDTIRRKGGDTRILIRTGEMRDSLSEPGHSQNILSLTNNSVLFGTENIFATYHTFGAGGLPRRPVMKFAPYDHVRWNRWIAEFLMDAMKA